MKRKIIIKNKGRRFNLNDYIEEITKKILMNDNIIIKGDCNNKNNYNVYLNNKKICDVIGYSLGDCSSFQFVSDNKDFEYKINNRIVNGEYVSEIELFKYNIFVNNTNYIFMRYINFLLISIENNMGNKINLSVETDVDGEKKIINSITEILISDSIEKIYERICKIINNLHNIEINKTYIDELGYRINNSLVVNNGDLISYSNIIEKDDVRYLIKKENNSYSCTVIDSSLDNLLNSISSECEVNKQLQIIKKLEKKK